MHRMFAFVTDLAKKFIFENSISFEVDIPDAEMPHKIPSLSLQLLLENAIKHNAFDESHPLKISIYKEDDMLVVDNNKKSRLSLQEGSGLGLKNIQDRYSLLSNRRMVIRDTLESFTVKLPILT